jgi:nucleotide-binding universal stress UspA family protein
MIRTILVPASGSEKDLIVFQTALEAAKLYRSHLAFYHIHISAGEALVHAPHARFVRGKGLRSALDELGEAHNRRSILAERHAKEFCSQFKIMMTDTPPPTEAITASWHESDSHNGEECLIAGARFQDLVVMGRFTRPNGLPSDLLEIMLIECGRPILIAGPEAPRSLTGTVMVCWKDTREPALAVTAAMPILAKAQRVIILAIDEGTGSAINSAAAVAQQLTWHHINTEAEVRVADKRSVADLLLTAAQSYGADLLIMGGYGKGRMRETVFGGCTVSMLRHANMPVLMVH